MQLEDRILLSFFNDLNRLIKEYGFEREIKKPISVTPSDLEVVSAFYSDGEEKKKFENLVKAMHKDNLSTSLINNLKGDKNGLL